MFTTLVSAVSYADIVFFVILGLGVLLGALGGLARAFKGFFKTVGVILVSILLVGLTLAPICKIGFVENLTVSLEGKTTSWGVVFTEPVHIAEDGSYYILVEYDGTQNKVKLEEASGTGLVDGAKGKLAVWLATRFITEDGQTLGRATADVITSLIVSVVMFIVYCIALGLICWILRKIFKGLHTSGSTAVRIIDRVLGAIVSAGLAMVFLLVALAILHALARVIPSAHEYLINSPVCGFLYQNNPISNIFGSIFG